MTPPLSFGTFLKIHLFCYRQPSLADVDAEKCVDNSLVQIWKLKFGHKINFLSKTLNTRFGQDFEVDAQARFWSWSLVSILLLILGWGYEDYSWSRFWSYVWSRFWSLSLVEMLIFGWSFEVAAWSRLWRWYLINICLRTCDMT